MSRPYASERHPHPPHPARVCEGCGCSDADACVDPATGEACAWAEGYPGDLCSVCAEVMVRIFAEPEDDAPLVALASEHEADLAIRERRKAAAR